MNRSDKSGGDDAPAESQRLDKWLWFVRVVKSRTLAATLVTDGRVRVNRQRVEKPSHALRLGDVITTTIRGSVRVLKVLGLGDRRGPPAEARLLFEDLTPPATPSGEAAPGTRTAPAHREPGSGRPTKRDRRRMDSLYSADE